MITIALRGLIFTASVAGWLMLLNKKYGIAMEFAPAVYCSGCSSLLFFAGLWNVLPEVAAVITLAGGLGLLWGLHKRLCFSKRSWIVLGCFGAVLLYAVWLLFGVMFVDTDNFSHWGLVIRELLLLDRLPNFADPVIEFQSYPLGSSLWSYYVCQGTGLGEDCFLLMQQVMQLSLILPVFAWMTKKNRALIFLPIGYGLYALCANVSVDQLQVDTLLGVTAAALFAVGVYYREEKQKAIWCALPLLVLQVQIKNSGIFFAAAFMLYFGFLWRKELFDRKNLGKTFLLLDVFVPLFSFLLWNRHVKYAFEAAEETIHAMSAANFAAVAGDKTGADIRAILAEVIRHATSLRQDTFYIMALMTLAIVIAMVWDKKAKKEWFGILLADWIWYLAYVAGLFGTYVFSMVREEAMYLAAYRRYSQTFGIFIFGFTVVQLTRCLNVEKAQKSAAVLCLIGAVLPFWNILGGGFQYETEWRSITHRMEPTGTVLETVRQQREQYGEIDDYMSYYVYFDKETESMSLNYLAHVLRYELRSHKLFLTGDFEACEGDIQKMDADYLYI